MYAIVENGGKQLKVKKGDTVLVDDLNLSPGDEFVFDKVLYFNDGEGDIRVGTPAVEGVTVSGTYTGLAKGPKLVAFKYRRRKSSQRKIGHRQHYGQVKIQDIAVA